MKDKIIARTKMWPDAEYRGIDAGVRFAVKVLHASGIDTCQSCESGPGHSYPEPSIDLVAGPDDARGLAAVAALTDYGLPVSELCLVWHIKNGLPYEKLWRIVFSRKMPERANDKPIFVWGYRGQ